jgi:hypothetical protein
MLKLIPRRLPTVVQEGDDTVVVGGNETNDPENKAIQDDELARSQSHHGIFQNVITSRVRDMG